MRELIILIFALLFLFQFSGVNAMGIFFAIEKKAIFLKPIQSLQSKKQAYCTVMLTVKFVILSFGETKVCNHDGVSI